MNQTKALATLFELNRSGTCLLVMAYFFLAISLSVKSVLLPMASLLILYAHREQAMVQFKNMGWMLLVVLFLLVCVDAFRGDVAWVHRSALIHKYSKLLYLPILALGLQDRHVRDYAIHAFLAGMLLTSLLLFFKFMHWIDFTKHGEDYDAGALFFNHIVTGYLMSFAAFVAGIYMMQTKGRLRYAYLALCALFVIEVVFISTGRTGYVLFVLLLALFLFHFFYKKLMLASCVLLLVMLAFSQSQTFKDQIKLGIDDVKQYTQGHKDSRIGFRIQFHDYAKKLFLEKPLLGAGTGAFVDSFLKDNPIPSWDRPLHEPHSDFWHIAVEHGLLGLALYFLFFGYLFYISTQIVDFRLGMQGLLLTFLAVSCFTDSWLFVSATGFLLVMFAALGIGEWLAQKGTLPHEYSRS